MAKFAKTSPLKALLFYSILMITLPVAAFFCTQALIFQLFGIPPGEGYLYATAVSVIVIHVILGLFVYEAFTEDDRTSVVIQKED
ncbi:vacuolar ATPase assembly integral membrane protein VMA21-like [Tachypleus tridentatus]|uniref:vacuolar ATPase assembly integral membrane protein VMA21-like n=1 Tax=Tachypleus tridentatus TaxID=6853 RepID=UPI003FD5FF47